MTPVTAKKAQANIDPDPAKFVPVDVVTQLTQQIAALTSRVMGVIIQDKSADYGSQFDAIISAAGECIAIGYFGNESTPASLRLGEFNETVRVGTIVPTGNGAVLPDTGGIQTEKDSGTTNPPRFVNSWKNASAKCCMLVVAHVAAGGGIIAFAGTRIRLDTTRKMGVRGADGSGRDLTTVVPDEAVCFFLNSNETSCQNGWITSVGAIIRVAFSNDAK
ncbi:phage protease [Erwinia tracheiphila]|uniref:phage protease n=1 Tax=Erwinia tracheiphila TaxID=65700 RepID=UPI001F1B2BE1|nr:phage protease [Erwinia tracheiphila]UIA84861.1 phage protease [Erwinia tracheiphila]UIA93456.1 phage protease [Erwinia tracheiphila]